MKTKTFNTVDMSNALAIYDAEASKKNNRTAYVLKGDPALPADYNIKITRTHAIKTNAAANIKRTNIEVEHLIDYKTMVARAANARAAQRKLIARLERLDNAAWNYRIERVRAGELIDCAQRDMKDAAKELIARCAATDLPISTYIVGNPFGFCPVSDADDIVEAAKVTCSCIVVADSAAEVEKAQRHGMFAKHTESGSRALVVPREAMNDPYIENLINIIATQAAIALDTRSIELYIEDCSAAEFLAALV